MEKLSQKTNYTKEQTEKLLELYESLGSDNLHKIAEIIEKPEKSIIAKLSRLGVYKKPEKVLIKKRTGPSKKEMLFQLEGLVGFDTTGFSSVNKQDLKNLIEYLVSLE